MAQSKPRNYKLHQDLMGCKGGAMKNKRDKRDKLARHQRKEHDQDTRDWQALCDELYRRNHPMYDVL